MAPVDAVLTDVDDWSVVDRPFVEDPSAASIAK